MRKDHDCRGFFRGIDRSFNRLLALCRRDPAEPQLQGAVVPGPGFDAHLVALTGLQCHRYA
jgi:hypothetical protein